VREGACDRGMEGESYTTRIMMQSRLSGDRENFNLLLPISL
jgi:hypothetical protein